MGSMSYVESDVPAGMTLVQWRRERHPAARPRRRLRLPVLRRPRLAI